jgi:hypothetical protein
MRSLAALVAALVLAPAASAITGQQRVLIMQVTWGPQPWPAAQGRESLSEAAAYIRSASFGRTWIDGTATEWLQALPGPPSTCDIRAVEAAGNAAAQAAGYNLSSYSKLGYAFPDIGCPWGGAYFSPGIWMHDRMDRFVVAHELGHTYGITEEGPAWACVGRRCASHNYANPYSVMGHGQSDFNVYEKLTFGWIDRVAQAAGNGDFTIGAIDRPGSDAHALHALAGGDEYWFEYRPPQPIWDPDEPMATPGIAVVAGPINPLIRSRFPLRDLLLLDPVGAGRSSVVAGETFAVPGAFALTVRSMEAARAVVSFRWTDRKRPSRPRIRVAGSTSVNWRASADAGSGVAAYEVSVDRRPARRVPAVVALTPTLHVPALLRLRYAKLGRGRHRVRVVSVDRAGNRSRPAVRTFVAP